MPLDPQVQAMMASVAGGKPVEQMTPQEMREALEERVRLTGGIAAPVAQVRDGQVPRQSMAAIPIRAYVPDVPRPMPCLVYFHGGGWVRGSLQTADILCRSLANGAQCAVISVDYRMAPEHRFPAAVEDSVAATRWVADNASQLGFDPARLAVGGDSAGGNLAAVVALLLRDAGGPRLMHQLLLYPVTDCSFDTPSYRENAVGYMLTRAAMQHYWQLYLGDDTAAADFRASPLRAANFADLPAATLITAEYDPLRDEGRAYADRLREAGVPVEYRELAGLVHGFATSAGALDAGRAAVDVVAHDLLAAFDLAHAGA